MHTASRLARIPTYIFAEMEARLKAAGDDGLPPVDLTRSDPDLEPPEAVPSALVEAAGAPGAHRYPPYAGLAALRTAFAAYLGWRFAAPATADDIHVVPGTKEALVHAFLALVDPGDVALVPDPAFPAYAAGAALAGAVVHHLPLEAERGFLPDLGAVPPHVLRRARVLALNYPNNPTGALAPDAFLEEVAAFARRHDLVVLYDQAYAELAPSPAPSLFARLPERTLEFYTFSKPFSMQGYRLGAVVARGVLRDAFARVEDNISAGVFLPVQAAGVAALESLRTGTAAILQARYQDRLRRLAAAFTAAGLPAAVPAATVYLWLRAPAGQDGDSLADRLLHEARVLVTPGRGFGPAGRPYVRVSATATDAEIDEACARIARLSLGPTPVRRGATPRSAPRGDR